MADHGIDPVAVLLRRWKFVLLVAFAAAAAVAAALLIRGPVYSSSALVRVVLDGGSSVSGASQVGSTGNEQAARILATQQDVVLSDEVIGQVAAQLKLTPDDVRAGVEVAPGKGSDTLRLTGQGDSPEAAQQLAAALADAYVEVDRVAGRARLKAAAEALQGQLDTLKAQRDALRAAGADPSTQDDLAAVQEQYNNLLAQQQARLAEAAVYPGNAFILNDATLVPVPSSMSLKMGAVLGFALGLILGCILALLSEFRQIRTAGTGDQALGGDEELEATTPLAQVEEEPEPDERSDLAESAEDLASPPEDEDASPDDEDASPDDEEVPESEGDGEGSEDDDAAVSQEAPGPVQGKLSIIVSRQS